MPGSTDRFCSREYRGKLLCIFPIAGNSGNTDYGCGDYTIIQIVLDGTGSLNAYIEFLTQY